MGPGTGKGSSAELYWAVVQAALLLEPYDSVDQMVIEESIADKDAVWSLWQVPISESQKI